VSSSLAGPLRLASVVICLIVIASFALFVVNQTSSASTHQQRLLNELPNASQSSHTGARAPAKRSTEGSARKTIDEVSKALTSPFSGITVGSSSQWVIRGVNLLLALIVYGFGLGYLARVLRVKL
jgi:predicted PurR-regulated permease PerM